MSKYIFNLNEKVEILCDGEFWGAEGEIVDVKIDEESSSTIYGIQLKQEIVYFKAIDIALV